MCRDSELNIEQVRLVISKILLAIAVIAFGIRQLRLNMKNVEERKTV